MSAIALCENRRHDAAPSRPTTRPKLICSQVRRRGESAAHNKCVDLSVNECRVIHNSPGPRGNRTAKISTVLRLEEDLGQRRFQPSNSLPSPHSCGAMPACGVGRTSRLSVSDRPPVTLGPQGCHPGLQQSGASGI